MMDAETEHKELLKTLAEFDLTREQEGSVSLEKDKFREASVVHKAVNDQLKIWINAITSSPEFIRKERIREIYREINELKAEILRGTNKSKQKARREIVAREDELVSLGEVVIRTDRENLPMSSKRFLSDGAD